MFLPEMAYIHPASLFYYYWLDIHPPSIEAFPLFSPHACAWLLACGTHSHPKAQRNPASSLATAVNTLFLGFPFAMSDQYFFLSLFDAASAQLTVAGSTPDCLAERAFDFLPVHLAKDHEHSTRRHRTTELPCFVMPVLTSF